MFRAHARSSPARPSPARPSPKSGAARVRNRLTAVLAGVLAVVLLPQAAVAKPAERGAAAPAPRLTLALLVEMERRAEAEREQRLLASEPIDDFELNRMLIQDLADYDEDAEVRAAAAAVLLSNDPVEFTAFLDEALPVYRAAANARRKRIAEANREAVQRWSENGGPVLRERAAAALATNNANRIADFVAIGRYAAEAAAKGAEASPLARR